MAAHTKTVVSSEAPRVPLPCADVRACLCCNPLLRTTKPTSHLRETIGFPLCTMSLARQAAMRRCAGKENVNSSQSQSLLNNKNSTSDGLLGTGEVHETTLESSITCKVEVLRQVLYLTLYRRTATPSRLRAPALKIRNQLPSSSLSLSLSRTHTRQLTGCTPCQAPHT